MPLTAARSDSAPDPALLRGAIRRLAGFARPQSRLRPCRPAWPPKAYAPVAVVFGPAALVSAPPALDAPPAFLAAAFFAAAFFAGAFLAAAFFAGAFLAAAFLAGAFLAAVFLAGAFFAAAFLKPPRPRFAGGPAARRSASSSSRPLERQCRRRCRLCGATRWSSPSVT